jgi:hypothetical protein
MNTTVNINESDRDEALVAFAQAGGKDLAEWSRRYPAFAGDFARYAAENWGGEKNAPADSAATAHVRQIGLEAVRRLRAASAVPAATPALTSLVAASAARGLDAEAVAAKLDVPYALFFKLHRRLIAPDSVPAKFVAALAEAVGRTTDEIASYLRQPATLAVGASYRADDTPTVGAQESFAGALQADPETTEAQQARWLTPEV